MKKSLFFIFLFFSFFNLSQSKLLKKASNALEDKNYKLVNYLLFNFQEENVDLFLRIEALDEKERIQNIEDLGLYYYTRAKLYFLNSSYHNIDESLKNFILAKVEFGKLKNLDSTYYFESCKKNNYCDDFMQPIENFIEDSVYLFYTKDSSIQLVENFIQKFPNSINLQKIIQMREDLYINTALKSNNLKEINACFIQFSESKRIDELKQKTFDIQIDQAIKEENIQDLKKLVTKSLNTLKKAEILLVLDNFYLTQYKTSKNIDSIQNYIRDFPNSLKKLEFENIIINNGIDIALAKKDIVFLESYLTNNPAAIRLNEIKKFIEDEKINQALASKSIEKIEEILILFPMTERRIEIESYRDNLK